MIEKVKRELKIGTNSKLIKDRGAIGKNNRNKGHTLERKLVKFFRDELNEEFCKTSRNASKLLDDCGVDLSGIPYNIQTKCGYLKDRPKADILFKGIKEKLIANFPSDDKIHNYPKILVHKIDGSCEENMLVTMTYKDWCKMMVDIHNLNKKS